MVIQHELEYLIYYNSVNPLYDATTYWTNGGNSMKNGAVEKVLLSPKPNRLRPQIYANGSDVTPFLVLPTKLVFMLLPPQIY